MKKLACVCIVAALLLLCACGDETVKNEDTTPTAASTVRVTFPEGYTVSDIASLLEQKGVCSADGFITAVNTAGMQTDFARAMGNGALRPFLLEGYVFPDTYDFYLGESPENALSRFTDNMKSKLTSEDYAAAEELGYTMDEIVTIASIIQCEASDKAQMGKVSSVLHNRLESDNYLRQLQCDVTHNYVVDTIMPFVVKAESTEQSTTETDDAPQDDAQYAGLLEKYSQLYNTYKFQGLPAGPICNPGYAAISAALAPEQTDYFYFVTDSEGNYYYSETYDRHAAKCRELGISLA